MHALMLKKTSSNISFLDEMYTQFKSLFKEVYPSSYNRTSQHNNKSHSKMHGYLLGVEHHEAMTSGKTLINIPSFGSVS